MNIKIVENSATHLYTSLKPGDVYSVRGSSDLFVKPDKSSYIYDRGGKIAQYQTFNLKSVVIGYHDHNVEVTRIHGQMTIEE